MLKSVCKDKKKTKLEKLHCPVCWKKKNHDVYYEPPYDVYICRECKYRQFYIHG